jgi:BCCT family betaine/carnitine transporter
LKDPKDEAEVKDPKVEPEMNEPQDEKVKDPELDPAVFWPTLIVLLAIAIPLGLNPEKGGEIVSSLLTAITFKFDWLFLIGTFACFCLVLYLALGKYGKVKLGQPNDKPEFSRFSYIAMLFCAGIGSSLMYWGIVEPISYMAAPPFGAEPFSAEAAEWASVYGGFHWGFSAWSIYAIVTLPIAYAWFVKKHTTKRASIVSANVIGDHAHGWPGKAIDILAMFGIVGGMCTSLGLGVPMVSALLSDITGVPESFGLSMAIVAIWTLIFGASVYLGIYKGIKRLSDINVYMVIALLAFVLLAGPTAYILSSTTNSIGVLLQNFIRMSFWTDPVGGGGFPQGWTVFYWAWWFALAIQMGLFVARISKGRTIRDVIFCEVVAGTAGCYVYFAIFGNYTINLQMSGTLPVAQIFAEQGGPAAIIAVLHSLPLDKIIIPIFVIVAFVFLATTLDSAAYILATISTKKIVGKQEPARWNRMLWCIMLGVTAVALLAVGGLDAVQISAVLTGLPAMLVVAILIVSLFRYLKADEKDETMPSTQIEVNSGGSTQKQIDV